MTSSIQQPCFPTDALFPTPPGVPTEESLGNEQIFNTMVDMLESFGTYNFGNIPNMEQQFFQNPFTPDIVDQVISLHNTAISSVLTGPQGYNGGSGPLSLQQASQFLNFLGGDYPYSIFGNPNTLNVYDVIISQAYVPNKYAVINTDPYGPLPVFTSPTEVPERISLFRYTDHVIPNIMYYSQVGSTANTIIRSGKRFPRFANILPSMSPIYDPCGFINLILGPILLALRLIQSLIDNLLNFIANIINAAINAIMNAIATIIERIARLIADALFAIIQALGLNELFALIAKLLSILNDPCVAFLLSGGAKYYGRILRNPLQNLLIR